MIFFIFFNFIPLGVDSNIFEELNAEDRRGVLLLQVWCDKFQIYSSDLPLPQIIVFPTNAIRIPYECIIRHYHDYLNIMFIIVRNYRNDRIYT